MKTDLYQLTGAVTRDTFKIVHDPFTTENSHGECDWTFQR